MALTLSRRRPIVVDAVLDASNQTVLPVPVDQQQATNWCWATCLQMALAYFGTETTQCSIASDTLGLACCGAGMPPACDQPLTDPDITATWNARGFTGVAYQVGSTDISVVRAEIVADRPVQVAYTWTSGGGHVALVVGIWWDPSAPWVYVNDPGWAARMTVSWAYLLTAYGQGLWDATWTGLSKAAAEEKAA